ncbi:metallophosphoesterase family protein [Clostridium magnum]|uniref:3',5'-cyclic adenosine monophosphate phosphodiesterase CpdA n=1 Tax=Clostridium magnum DSM 2767 TaxID=1121326 RepID=A0A162SPP1_9CLOT|nr:metallophosphoesterase [Clostridium magnum]KZL91704.1 3',5'-cyclic adenosine monophosphate phosphodiesterase CpdA [Clostridium magnum DSM 2767]SHJ39398.1 3',5'-cyclic AMP phosphodiesterase CpdA [Clostridium magnum DSM 2767]
MESSKIRWIHLSDIHYSYQSYDTLAMKNKLYEYLDEITSNEKYDFLIITGDICYRFGKMDEQMIEKLSSICKIDCKNIYMVPGNHDIKRGSLRGAILDLIKKQNNVRDIYVSSLDKEFYSELVKGQNKFWKYHEKHLCSGKYDFKKVHSIIEKENYNIICMNTCFFSGQDGEEGNLVLGLRNHLEVLGELDKNTNKVNIAIGHHGIDCFHEEERDSIIYNFIDSGVDMYLCGHVHNGNYKFYNNDLTELPVLTSGSLMLDGYAKATFITGEIELKTKECVVKYHSWINDIQKWDIDNTIGRRLKNQRLTFDLSRFKKKDEFAIEVSEDEFQEFIIEFIEKSTFYKANEYTNIAKDVYDKFSNMLCLPTTVSKFDELSKYFYIIDGILLTNELFNEKRLIIDNLITDEYRNCFYTYNDGDKIIDFIVNSIYNQYKDILNYSKMKFKFFIKILVYWMINFCSIFNEKKVI